MERRGLKHKRTQGLGYADHFAPVHHSLGLLMSSVQVPSAPPLQISLITETYPPEVNGVALTLQRLLTGLIAEGHAVQLIRPRQSAADRPLDHDRAVETVLYSGVPIPRYPDLRLGLPAYVDLKRRWRQQRPHLIHIATEGPLGLSALYAAKHLRIPITSGFHTNFHRYSRHYGIGFLQSTITAYLRYFHNQCVCTLVPTEALRRELEIMGFRGVRILSRGIDTQLFHPRHRQTALRTAWGVDDDAPVALYVGRLAAEKNLELAVTAFQAMHRANPRSRFVLVGSGPLHDSLRQQHPDLIFCGVQTGDALAAHYASADIFLFPSQTETFGNVILEAMASGLAVVAFDDAAAKEHVRDGDNGRRVACDDPQGFVQAAADLAVDLPTARAMGARAFVDMQSHGWAAVSQELVHLFNEFAQVTP